MPGVVNVYRVGATGLIHELFERGEDPGARRLLVREQPRVLRLEAELGLEERLDRLHVVDRAAQGW